MGTSVRELLDWIPGRVANLEYFAERCLSREFATVAALGEAQEMHLAFFFSKEYQQELLRSKAGVLVTGEAFVEPLKQSGLPLWSETVIIAVKDPYLAMAQVSNRLWQRLCPGPGDTSSVSNSIHPTAVLDPTCRIGAGVVIGAYCVLGANCVLGDGVQLGSGCTLGSEVELGASTVLFPRVTIYDRVKVGANVRIHSGVVLGADGFGYALERSPDGKPLGHCKIQHFGSVRIGDDVEIGANTCVDRGTFEDTIIGKGAKLDNQVQVGHNVVIEQGAIICGCAGLAGSSHVGAFALVGGLVGISNGVSVGAGAKVAACSLLSKDVPAGTTVAGNPQREVSTHFRIQALMNRLASSRKERNQKRENQNNETRPL